MPAVSCAWHMMNFPRLNRFKLDPSTSLVAWIAADVSWSSADVRRLSSFFELEI